YCPSRTGGSCSAGKKRGCRLSFEAWVFDRREGRKARKTFRSKAEAKAWRRDALRSLERGELGSGRLTVREAGEAWLTAALGEPRALRWSDVDLASGVIRVSRGWDAKEGEIAPKSRKGERETPILALLRDDLIELKASTGRGGRDFVFGSRADAPFTPSYIR